MGGNGNLDYAYCGMREANFWGWVGRNPTSKVEGGKGQLVCCLRGQASGCNHGKLWVIERNYYTKKLDRTNVVDVEHDEGSRMLMAY